MSQKRVCVVLIAFAVICAGGFAGYHFRDHIKRSFGSQDNSTTTAAPKIVSTPPQDGPFAVRTSEAPATDVQSLLAERSLDSGSPLRAGHASRLDRLLDHPLEQPSVSKLVPSSESDLSPQIDKKPWKAAKFLRKRKSLLN